MRVLLLLLVTYTVYTASAVPLEEIGQTKVYPRYIQFPDGDGNYHLVDLEEEPDYELLDEINRNPANNRYILYTRRNPKEGQYLVMNSIESIRNSNFNARVPTVVVAHGWISNQNSDLNAEIRDAYLEKYEVNVIIIDWRRLATSTYTTAARGVPAVGRGLGQFIRFLCETSEAKLDLFHLVGFSLGAHLVGSAGRELDGRVARITGLDPAGPLWTDGGERIRAEDAVYVEAIHTDGGLNGLGIGSDVADADFYPNGGTNQPGCLLGICDHNRAWEYFASTVKYNHLIANHCESAREVSRDNCRGYTMRMGNDNLHKEGSGKFRVNTGRRYPF